MKKSTQRIVEQFPELQEHVIAHESILKGDGVLSSLSPVQRIFLQLACFFEHPEKVNFDLSSLYKELDNDWLEWALELITQFFREDTFLIQKPSYTLIKDGSVYLNQSQLAHFLTDQKFKV